MQFIDTQFCFVAKRMKNKIAILDSKLSRPKDKHAAVETYLVNKALYRRTSAI